MSSDKGPSLVTPKLTSSISHSTLPSVLEFAEKALKHLKKEAIMKTIKVVGMVILLFFLIALLLLIMILGASVIVYAAYVSAAFSGWSMFQVWIFSIGSAMAITCVFIAMDRWERTKKIRWWVSIPLEILAIAAILFLSEGIVNLLK
jgi:uncharacterized BrkB/YihY/UPF0761 family membrane protein